MLKAHGFDKAENQHVLELFTDIAIRYLNLLVRKLTKYMELRDDCVPNIKDITDTFLDLKIISPAKRLDKYDISATTSTGIENFEKWFNHEINTRMREVARPDRDFLQERKMSKLKTHDVSSKMDSLTKALDEQSKQAQLQNPTMPYLPPPSVVSNKQTPTSYGMYQNIQPFPQVEPIFTGDKNGAAEVDDEKGYDIPSNAMDEDWIQYLIRDQIYSFIVANNAIQKNSTQATNSQFKQEITHLKPNIFEGSVLQEYVPEDLKPLVAPNSKKPNNEFLIAGPMPEKLLHTFPYYKSEDESSDFDSDCSDGGNGENEREDEDDDEDDEDDDDDSSDTDDDENDVGAEGNNSHVGSDEKQQSENNSKMDVDNNASSGLAAYDYYEHHTLYENEMEDLDLYGQGDSNSNGLNLFG